MSEDDKLYSPLALASIETLIRIAQRRADREERPIYLVRGEEGTLALTSKAGDGDGVLETILPRE